MNDKNYIDPEMREILDALGTAIVPRNRRKACFSTSWHTPYYSRERYKRVA